MRKKVLFVITIWVVVGVIVLLLYFMREVSPVKEFIAWALGVWSILAAIGGIGVILTVWVIKHDFNEKGKEHLDEELMKGTANPLENIKTDLIKINAFEREAATRKAKQLCPEIKAVQIHDDCLEIWGTDINKFLAPILYSVIIKHNHDPVINFFKGFGDILDSNNYGLKAELQNNELYDSSRTDIAQKRLHLKTTDRKKKSITQKNINRVLSLIYGLNSTIILRGVLDSISTDKMRIPALVRVGLEGVETLGEQILNQMLDDLEHEWKPVLNLAEFRDMVTKLNDVLAIVNARMGKAEGVTNMARKNEEQELLAFYQRQKENWRSNLRLRITNIKLALDDDVPKVTFDFEMVNFLPIEVKLAKVIESSGTVNAIGLGLCALPAFEGETIDKKTHKCDTLQFSLKMKVAGTRLPEFLKPKLAEAGQRFQWTLKAEWYIDIEGKTETWNPHDLLYDQVIAKQ
jgi:hypothetical protein